MKNGDTTAESREMAALNAGNHTHAADDIDWFVSQIVSLCQWQFLDYTRMILNCLHTINECQIGHLVEPYLMSSVEIGWSTCSVNKDGGHLF